MTTSCPGGGHTPTVTCSPNYHQLYRHHQHTSTITSSITRTNSNKSTTPVQHIISMPPKTVVLYNNPAGCAAHANGRSIITITSQYRRYHHITTATSSSTNTYIITATKYTHRRCQKQHRCTRFMARQAAGMGATRQRSTVTVPSPYRRYHHTSNKTCTTTSSTITTATN